MKTLLQIFDKKLKDTLKKLNFSFDENKEVVQNSNRSDISDFQCNEALRLAKQEGKNPREIAQAIANELKSDSEIESISIDGPGFINIKTSSDLLTKHLSKIYKDEKLGYSKDKNYKLIIDFSSPNIAKPLHVGHLRSVIGESLKRIMRFAGDEIIGDNHLGDWGKPYGLTIALLKDRQPNLPYFNEEFNGEYPTECPVTIEDLEELYPSASTRSKEDKEFNSSALEITRNMQYGHKGYRALLNYFRNITIEDLKKTYKDLDISFDTWYGESFYNDMAIDMIKDLENKGFLKLDNGAKIIELKTDQDKKEMPPIIIEKSGGGIMYGSTDMAGVKYRIEEEKADGFLILTDNRQGIHFEQVFRASEKIGLLNSKNIYEHIAFGTVNGKDGKPFKTRDGGTMKLKDLIQETKDKVYELLKNRDVKGEDKNELSRKIGMSALKFADMSNDIKSGYVFDLEKFISFEGKTGPYILYSLVRLNSVLNKVESIDSTGKLQEFTNNTERDLMLHMTKVSDAISKAYKSRSPHHLCEFIYELCQKFSKFYNECHVANESNENLKAHRIEILKIAKKEIETIGNLIGLEFVKAM